MNYCCSVCDKEYPYLIFEYNTLVCEKCSIRKNISNSADFDQTEEQAEVLEPAANVDERDVEQLMELIEQIENPRIREDFLSLAQQYLWGEEQEG